MSDRFFTVPPDLVMHEDEIYPMSSVPNVWHIPKSVFEPIWRMGITGKGVVIAHLDTGVNSHPLLPKPIAARNFTSSPGGVNSVRDVHGHGCISPTDEIYTSNCGLQQIQTFFNRMDGMTHFLEDGSIIKDITRYNINTFSLNCSGKIPKIERKQVTHVHKLPFKGDMVVVSINNSELSLTPWHPVYVMTSCRGKEKTITKKRADELKIGDKVCIVPNNDVNISDDYLDIPLERNNEELVSHKLDAKLAYYAGLMFTDGHLRKLSKDVEFHSKDVELIKIFVNLTNEIFGIKVKYQKIKNRNCYRVKFCNAKIHKLLNSIGIKIGNKSKTSDLPELICKSPRDVIESFIAGCIEGDGCVSGHTTRLISGSKDLAIRMTKLIKSLGIKASWCISRSKEHISSTGNKFKDSISYVVKIGSWHKMEEKLVFKKTNKTKQSNNFASRIQKITTKAYEGFMYDFTVADNNNYVANGMIVSNTHVSGTSVGRDGIGFAPEASHIFAKVLGDRGSGSSSWINSGRVWAAKEGADIISESLGGGSGGRADTDAIQAAYELGICLDVCAAGNAGYNGANTIGYPGRYEAVACIGAHTQTGSIANFSSGGREIDYAAPGQNILSTSSRGGFQNMSGTSMATPSFAGLLALVIHKRRITGHPDLKGIKAWKEFFNTPTFLHDAGQPGWDPRFGFGKLLIENILNWLKEPINI